MPFDQIAQAILHLRFIDVVQILAIIFVVLYLVFALVIVRQIQLMTKTLLSPVAPILIFLGIIHVGVVLAILILLVGVI